MTASTSNTNASRGLFGLSVLLLTVTAIIAVVSLYSLIVSSLTFVPTIGDGAGDRERAGNDRYAQLVSQIDGRTMFFTPARPPDPPPAPVVRRDEEPVDPPPARYGGPKVVGLANGMVWFADDRQVLVGGEAVGDLRVISTEGPWIVTVEWRGIEFDVPFLERDDLILPEESSSELAGDDGELSIATNETVDPAPEEERVETAETNEEEPGLRADSQPGDESE